MNSLDLKKQIKTYLSRFETLVRISSLNNEYDIHNHSEILLTSILNKLYNWELKNANVDDKNAQAIDLIDIQNGIAVQVSSNNKIEKIKETLQKILTSKYKDSINEIYFYFLISKQKSYSSNTISKLTKGKILFNVKKNILDNETLYAKIKQITNISKLREIEALLKGEFSDLKLNKEVDINDYEIFKSKYRASCLNNYSRLNFFGLSIPNKPREVQLYSLFVKPSFSPEISQHLINITLKGNNIKLNEKLFSSYIQTKLNDSDLSSQMVTGNKIFTEQKIRYGGSTNPNVKFSDLFKLGKHIVLLGDPGAGKSSLIKYSICKIIEEDYETFQDRDVYTYLPYRIELHKYNQFKKEDNGNFLDYIRINLSKEFLVDTDQHLLVNILEKCPSLIFFDGLDEIFDIQERIEIRNDIENFIKHHSLIRSIVTSRYESYNEVKFDAKVYNLVNVMDFSQEQIEEYVEKWYHIEEVNEKLREHEVKDCMNQLKNVDNQLKHNPLLLSLILILYRNEQDLPTSKLEIYEGCSQTLVETRDKKEKKLRLNLKVPHKISVFSNLAFWQFNTESRNEDSKIDYRRVKTFITNYLIDKGEFTNHDEAEEASVEFLDYAKLRSIYIENKFSHKTFYEYFTSHYIFSNYYSTPGEFSKFMSTLEDNIGLSAWAVILELLICQVDGSQLEYKVMDGIIDKLLGTKLYESCILFLTVMPYLRTLSPNKGRLIIKQSISLIYANKITPPARAILKDKLFETIKNKRFENLFYTELQSFLEESSEASVLTFEFALELNATRQSEQLKSLLFSFREYSDSQPEKYYIISAQEAISDPSLTMETFKQFYEIFGNVGALKTYVSRFDLPCFGMRTAFNWMVLLFMQAKNRTEIVIVEKELRELNISKENIVESLRIATTFLPHDVLNILSIHKSYAKEIQNLSEIIYKTYKTVT